MNKIFCADGNFYLHRCWSTLKTSRPIEDVLPPNFCGLVMKDACLVKATHILVAFDGPSIFRYDLYDNYKGDRREAKIQKDDEAEGKKDIYQYLSAVRAYLTKGGITWVQKKKYEADDVLASCLLQYGNISDTLVIAGTGDKDIYQALHGKHKVYNSGPKEKPIIIDSAKAEKLKGVPISGMIMYQTLLGDKIDSIPQILPPAKARKAVLEWKTFKNWYTKGTKEDKRWLNANQVKLTLNRKLVELVTDLSLPEVHELKVPKLELPQMPKAWQAYQELTYPKRKSLFRR